MNAATAPRLVGSDDLRDLPPGSVVFKVETPEEVEVFWASGTPSCCAPLDIGGGQWRQEYTEELRGHHLVIIPSFGYPRSGGPVRAQTIARQLRRACASVKVTPPPPVPGRPAGGISDILTYLGAGGKVEDLVRWAVEAEAVEPRPTNGRVHPGQLRGIFTAQELAGMHLPPIPWLIDRLLPEGCYILAGRPKTGKSWLGLSVALAVACPEGRVLGREITTPGPVLYCALEDGQRRLMARMRQLEPNESLWPSQLEFVTEIDAGPEAVQALEAWCVEKEEAGTPPRLIVVDTLGRMRDSPRPGRSVYFEDLQAVAPLHALARRHHLVVILVDHQRKAEAEDIFDTISGSLGKFGTVDGAWVLVRRRGVNFGKLHVTGRDVEESELWVEFDPTRGLWQVAAPDPLQGLTPLQRTVFQVFSPEDAGLSTEEVAKKARMPSTESVRSHLRLLARLGLVSSVGRGKWALGRRSPTSSTESTSSTGPPLRPNPPGHMPVAPVPPDSHHFFTTSGEIETPGPRVHQPESGGIGGTGGGGIPPTSGIGGEPWQNSGDPPVVTGGSGAAPPGLPLVTARPYAIEPTDRRVER
ncbi:MAG: AAA family ATPase [Candidatus Dormibacteria bacterium]